MKALQLKRMRGVGLLEGLVAVAILAFGLLALFNLQAGVLTSGADAKARTEALQVAESKLGELRTVASSAFASQAVFLAATGTPFSGTQTVAGTNANYTVSWAATNIDSGGTAPRKRVQVTVAWSDRLGAQSMASAADINWVDPALGGLLLTQNTPNAGVPSPTGEAKYILKPYATDAAGNPTGGTLTPPNEDGTAFFLTDSGKFQLLDLNSNLILIEAPSALFVISGRVFVHDMPVLDTRDELSQLKVGAPDVSWCTTYFDTDESGNELYEVAGGGETIYGYVKYNCYVGKGWYGSIGPTWTGGAQTVDGEASQFDPNDRVCVGDDSGPVQAAVDSKHPQLSFIRTYRGYSPLTIGGEYVVDINGHQLYSVIGVRDVENGAGAFEYTHQDFLLATIPGTAQDADCAVRLEQGDIASAPTDIAPVWPDYYEQKPADEAWRLLNPGKFVCLTQTCSADWDQTTVAALPLSISGSFLVNGLPAAGAVQSVSTSDRRTCALTGSGDSYVCTVYDLGNGWTGSIDVVPATGYDVIGGPAQPIAITSNTGGIDFSLGQRRMTIRGEVKLHKASFISIVSSPNAVCSWSRNTGGTGVSGPFECVYPEFAGAVTLALSTTGQLCSSSGTPSAISAVSGNALTISGMTTDLSDVTIELRDKCR